ncbi:MAG: HAD-IA family hydrolase [Patescibacteria group bacterium]
MKLIIFDFDGVIADSFQICLDAIRMFLPHMTADRYRLAFSGNIRDAEWRKTTKIDESVYYASYDPALLSSKPFDGMSQVVRELAKSYRLSIVSSTPAPVIREYLSKNEMDVFEKVLGHETHQYKDVKIQLILDDAKSDTKDAVLVTDTLGDILEARKIGLEAIAVTWGFQRKETLMEGNPKMLVEAPKQLLESINFSAL